MKRTDRFRDLAELRGERERLRALRNKHQAALQEYWDLVHEKDFRQALAGDAFGDMLRAWRPLRTLGRFFQSDENSVGTALGLVMGSRARTLKGRVLTWVVSMLAPMVIKKYGTPERLEQFAEEVKRSWSRIRERMRDRAEQ